MSLRYLCLSNILYQLGEKEVDRIRYCAQTTVTGDADNADGP